MPFIANTDSQTQAMLDTLGLTMDDLFADIPESLRCGPLDLPDAMNEMQVRNHAAELAGQNAIDLTCFLGGGFYDHFIPSAVYELLGRSEFYTAYTPYQPELSQGTLQAIFEYQSAICRLTDMEVANASLYDGGTALYEAMMMAMRITRRGRIIIDSSVNPIYRRMIESYSANLNIELVTVAHDRGIANRQAIIGALDDQTAAVIVQNPTFFGCVDDLADLSEAVHRAGALMIGSFYPIALALFKTPRDMGFDIVTGEGQSLGLPMSFGGPYLGFMATMEKYVRKMPGRLVGQAHDAQGRRGFVLTLQAREQHIRRDKATSNICSNEALCALTALIYMSLMGKQGLCDVAQLCMDKAAYAVQRLTAIDGVSLRHDHRTVFNEFVLDVPGDAAEIIGRLIGKGLAAGFPLSRYYPDMTHSILIAVTEKRTKTDIGILAEALEAAL